MQSKSAPARTLPDLTTPPAPVPSLRAIGETLRAARYRRGRTQTDIASASLTNKSHLHRIECGKVPEMGLIRFLRICSALQVSPDHILTLASRAEAQSGEE